jgi:hypothetical protein
MIDVEQYKKHGPRPMFTIGKHGHQLKKYIAQIDGAP